MTVLTEFQWSCGRNLIYDGCLKSDREKRVCRHLVEKKRWKRGIEENMDGRGWRKRSSYVFVFF
jgi:hypothetical protein